jgi:hypothetical protein
VPGFFDPLPSKGWSWSPDSLRRWLNGQTIDPTKIRPGPLSDVTDLTVSGLLSIPVESDIDTGNRTFTNTGYLDLDALTGGSGSIGAVAVTVDTDTRALVIITATLRNQTAASTALLSYRVSGATTTAASDNHMRQGLMDGALPSSTHISVATLTAGSNTFELQARVTANTGQIGIPQIIVIPL